MAILYGDGIHDDSPAIQEMLDGGCLCALPAPEKFYLLGRTLLIGSGRELTLPRYAVIRLADGVNAPMLKNADPVGGNANFSVTGGIWDYNNLGQAKNPFHFHDPALPEYNGYMFDLRNVCSFRFADMTMKDPVTFCLTLDAARDFTVENITFDFNYGNPWAINMDGVHLDGNCHYGLIRNLRGACYDDMVALNSDEGSNGPISHIEVDGLFCEDCHSAVRLLSVKNAVEHIHIHNVHGTFYQYCIGITKYYPGKSDGWYDDLVFENIHASKAERKSVYQKDGSFEYPLIWFEGNLLVKNAVLRGLYRHERECGVPLIKIEKNTTVESLRVSEVVQTAKGVSVPVMMLNEGEIGSLCADSLRVTDGETLINEGVIRENR